MLIIKKLFLKRIIVIFVIIPAISATAQNDDNKSINAVPEKSIEATSEFKHVEIPTASMYLFPYTNILSSNPALWNYDLSDSKKFLNNFFYVLFNQREVYMGLGGYENSGASLKWIPTNNLSLEAKAFFNKQYGYNLSSFHTSLGMGLLFNYRITDRLKLHLWGQYITPGNTDPFLNSSLFPKTNVGAELQYKATKKTDIGIGVEFMYDNKRRTWKSESGGKVKIGF